MAPIATTTIANSRAAWVRSFEVAPSRWLAIGFALALLPTHLPAQTDRRPAVPHVAAGGGDSSRAPVTVLPIHNGTNRVDLLGTGKQGEIIVSRRDNGNVHGFSVVLFQVLAPSRSYSNGRNLLWQVIPFFGGPNDPEAGEELFATFEGADCTLRDLRVVRTAKRHPVEVVTATRDFGNSFADSAAVRFDFYELRDGKEGFGPTYLFRHARTVHAKGRYCDVDDAFDRELGLGTAGVLRWDGPR